MSWAATMASAESETPALLPKTFSTFSSPPDFLSYFHMLMAESMSQEGQEGRSPSVIDLKVMSPKRPTSLVTRKPAHLSLVLLPPH